MLKATGLEKSFGAIRAVDGVSFEVRAGEAFGLLGPNGAGKSTTISMLIGLLKPDRGDVLLRDNLRPTSPETRRRIGIAPQSLSLYEELTGRENLEFYARMYGLSRGRMRRRVDWSLEFAGLTDRANDFVAAFSGGMKRRLNLAVALLHEPDLLLLDEPTVGVDPQSRNHLLESIEQLKGEGLTILFTTHYMEEAERICDRIAIMDHGQLLAVDTLEGLARSFGGVPRVFAELESLPDAAVLPVPAEGNHLTFEAADPLAEVMRLSAAGVRFTSLEVKRPSLENVFLSLTGRSLRDA